MTAENEELKQKLIDKIEETDESKLNKLKSTIAMFKGMQMSDKAFLNERLKLGPKTKKTLKRRAKNKMASKTRRSNAKNN